MVTRYSFVLDILKDPAKSFEGSSKVDRKWVVGRKATRELESFIPNKAGFDRCQMCSALGC